MKRDIVKGHAYIEKHKGTIAQIAKQKADFEDDIQLARALTATPSPRESSTS